MKIKLKFLIGLSIILSMICIFGLWNQLIFRKVIRDSRFDDSFHFLHKSLLHMRNAEKEFLISDIINSNYFLTGYSENINYFNKSYSNFILEYNDVFHQIADHSDYLDNLIYINNIETEVSGYYSNFRILSDKIKQLGFEDWGLVGALRDSAHKIEQLLDPDFLYVNDSNRKSSIKQASENNLFPYLLLIRRAEKDYLLRKSAKYFKKNLALIKQFRILLKKSALNTTDKNPIELELEKYNNIFIQIDEIENETGFFNNTGIVAEYRNSIQRVEAIFMEIDKFLMETTSQTHKKYIIISWIFYFCIILFCGLLFVFISKIIIAPIKKFTEATERVKKGDLSIKVQNGNKDEFSLLVDSFNEMTDELNRTNQELKESAAQLLQSEKMAVLGELAAGVVHELKQPMTVIKLVSQSGIRSINKSCFNSEKAEKDLAEIVNQINKMSFIIEHVKSFSRIETITTNEKIDINKIIKDSFAFTEQQLLNHNIEINIRLNDDLPLISANPVQIEQIIINLVTNARHALDSPDIQNKTIEIETLKDEKENGIMILVKDNGPGIADDIKENIFKPFFTTKEAGKGTGLGLSIVTKIVEAHSGKIELASKPGEGAVFKIFLPV